MNSAATLGLARREVRTLSSYNAGLSIEAVQQRFGVSRVAKLGSNENHFGPSDSAILAMQEETRKVGLYPDANCSELRAALSAKLRTSENRFVFGNGSEDLLAVISRVFLDHGDQVVTVLPSFGLHIIYPQSVGAEVITVPMNQDMSVDVSAVIDALSPRTRLLMFSCPSNPVGTALTGDELQSIINALSPNTLFVFDEAYFEYAQLDPRYPDALAMLEASGKPFILLRTFSKAYGLAGARVGYGITSDAQLANLIDRLRTPFNLNRIAQAGALAALADEIHLLKGLNHVKAERERMAQALCKLDTHPLDSFANFLFFRTNKPASKIYDALLMGGVIVKPWKEEGYTEWLRVSIGSRDDNDLFLENLASLLER